MQVDIVLNGTTKCFNCGAIIRPHRVCTGCGFYKCKKVLSKKAAN